MCVLLLFAVFSLSVEPPAFKAKADKLRQRRREILSRDRGARERIRPAVETREEAAIQRELDDAKEERKKLRDEEFGRRVLARRRGRDGLRSESDENQQEIMEQERELHEKRRDLMARRRDLARAGLGRDARDVEEIRAEEEKVKADLDERRSQRMNAHEEIAERARQRGEK